MSRLELLGGRRQGERIEMEHPMRRWDMEHPMRRWDMEHPMRRRDMEHPMRRRDYEGWRRLIDASSLVEEVAYDGNAGDRPELPVGPVLEDHALTWHQPRRR